MWQGLSLPLALSSSQKHLIQVSKGVDTAGPQKFSGWASRQRRRGGLQKDFVFCVEGWVPGGGAGLRFRGRLKGTLK